MASQTLLVLEDGSSVPTANSYCTVAQANGILQSKLDNKEWITAGTTTVPGDTTDTYPSREAALISASILIDTDCRFRGFRKSMTQGLEWPRIRARNDDFYGQMPGRITALLNVYYDESSIPLRLQQATAQVALDLLRDATRMRDNTAIGIKSASIGQNALAITFDQARLPVPLSMEAQRLLQKLIISFRYGLGTVKLVRVQ